VRLLREFWEAEASLAAGGVDAAVVAMDGAADRTFGLLRRFGHAPRPAFLILSQKADMLDRVLALELGAADVAELSLLPRELAARVNAVLQRLGGHAPELLVLENATVDLKAALVMHHRSGHEELLSPGQLAMLRLFLARPRTVLSRDEVLAVAPAEAVDAFDRSVDSRIVRLRRKLDTERIVTIRGLGYRYDPLDAAGNAGGEENGGAHGREAEQALRVKESRENGGALVFPFHGRVPPRKLAGGRAGLDRSMARRGIAAMPRRPGAVFQDRAGLKHRRREGGKQRAAEPPSIGAQSVITMLVLDGPNALTSSKKSDAASG
jgi:two-component system, OmpR family, response regulator